MTPEEAKREVEWWSKEHNRDAVRAFSNGGKVQIRNSLGKWDVRDYPSFGRKFDWRPLPEPTLRPYTDEELRGMVGKVFVDKANNSLYLADCYNQRELHLAEWGDLSGDELLRECTHLDGSPCGVME